MCRKAKITEKNRIETSGNSYRIETSKLIYITNQFTGSCVKRGYGEMFLKQTIPIFKPSG